MLIILIKKTKYRWKFLYYVEIPTIFRIFNLWEKTHYRRRTAKYIWSFQNRDVIGKREIPIISKKEYTDDVENIHDIKWCNVGNLHGVNKLKTDSVLSVSNELTVVYGENGCGKSGYTRLLNNAFISINEKISLC